MPPSHFIYFADARDALSMRLTTDAASLQRCHGHAKATVRISLRWMPLAIFSQAGAGRFTAVSLGSR